MTAIAIEQAPGPLVRDPLVGTSLTAECLADWSDSQSAWSDAEPAAQTKSSPAESIQAKAESIQAKAGPSQCFSDPPALAAPALAASPSMENCDALLVSLASRRIIVARRGQRVCLWSAERFCRPLRSIKPGEKVFYNGQLDTVRAIAIY